ncbi:hypothetical protein CONPUDRAFT_130068 [Coniophora puteana RWD-64-598 SS2]|uniref:Glycoside hydrolase family 3 N-terminal domain-containing protein n=1 Tax=Coniophora puteana (strain RWD-64-598) TaxID=741705 RepID=A0A5M3MCK2_CONPW|nr:uncharacterized protein CONPUDRAFT_130068 [Coniophora puteana RWD-64-598 SS2]EIW76982.1 hypothetical protein CONPUDRAFT_130068 [Coniophora puteana RWD-64-598 SS2]
MSAELTDAQKREIGQHFVFGFHGHQVSDDVRKLIQEYYVGSIILMKRNVQSIKQVHALVQDLQRLAKDAGHERPLMIGIDQECGLVSAFSSTAQKSEAGTQFPGAMAIAATGDPNLAGECAKATGLEMKAAGINWAYSPVADVNSDPRNPVIGVRSFGDDAKQVGEYVAKVSQGLADAGIAPSPKHFPGHGDTHVDSHLALPVIDKSKDAILATELVPFIQAIQQNVATIMTGHMALPKLTGSDKLPCSLSRAITTDLLRGELKFDGVIVTDCLEMDAVVQEYGSEGGAVMSLQAGADIVMICHTMERHEGSVRKTYEAVSNGTLSMDELVASGRRIAKLKDEFAGTWNDVLDRSISDAEIAQLAKKNARLSAEAYARSTALVQGSVPHIDADKTVLVLFPETESLNKAVDDAEGVLRTKEGQVRNTAGPHYVAFADSVKRRRPNSKWIVYSPLSKTGGEIGAEVVGELKGGGLGAVIFVTRNADQSGWQLEYLRRVQEVASAASDGAATPIVMLASCGPYEVIGGSERVDGCSACVASFEYTPAALEAACAVILRERRAVGRVPVRGGGA